MAKVETMVTRRNWSCKHMDTRHYTCTLGVNKAEECCPDECSKMEEVSEWVAKKRTKEYWGRMAGRI